MLGDVFFRVWLSLATGRVLSGLPGFLAKQSFAAKGVPKQELGNQGNGWGLGKARHGLWGPDGYLPGI